MFCCVVLSVARPLGCSAVCAESDAGVRRVMLVITILGRLHLLVMLEFENIRLIILCVACVRVGGREMGEKSIGGHKKYIGNEGKGEISTFLRSIYVMVDLD
jgi:hypothetical protein